MAKAQRAPSAAPSDLLGYEAEHIEVLEGLEAVRRRPGMYVGGTDARAAHHLFAEILDNAMDEAIAGHADRIEVGLDADGSVTVTDNGRGIPVAPHPKFPGVSTLQVVLTILHAGGKFSDKAYQTSGGLNGVGVSVVNALSDQLIVEVARERRLYRQAYARGTPLGPVEDAGPVSNRRGTSVRFRPDVEIFAGAAALEPARLFAMTRSKAYLRPGVRIRWRCAPERLLGDVTPTEAEFHFPGGLADYLAELLAGKASVTAEPFAGEIAGSGGGVGRVAWAVGWTPDGFEDEDGFLKSYANTIPTPNGGTHEAGLRNVLTRGLRAFADLKGDKRAQNLIPEDVMGAAGALVSVFVREPEFQGQTKDKLTSLDAQRLVEQALRDPFDHWLAKAPKEAEKLLAFTLERAEARLRRRRERELTRKSATRKLRLPGKLTDCSRSTAEGTELFIVEGDSAGGSAKQARNRETQAILPLRGKILNVASAGADKLAQNQELADLALALGVGLGPKFKLDDLRYERVVIMTDADVDGAHIAALLITFFFTATPGLIEAGRLYLALPPLFRLTKGATTVYARDEAHKAELIRTQFKGSETVDVGRFKGLGEMMPAQLKVTTMDPATRTLARVVRGTEDPASLVAALMGKRPELRFQFIQERARFVEAVDA